MIAIIAILAALLLPAIMNAKAKAQRAQCVNNLREAGLAFHAFAHDHDGKLPAQVPKAAGGAQEFAQTAYQLTGEFYFAHEFFRPLSNELVTPKMLFCPSDSRLAGAKYAAITNGSLSYFVGINADMALPRSVLSGDRNLTNDYLAPASLLKLGSKYLLRWTHELHRFKGNLLLTDGHVDEVNSLTLTTASDPNAVADLVIPSVNNTEVAGQPAGSGGTGSSGSSGQGPTASSQNPQQPGSNPSRTPPPNAGMVAANNSPRPSGNPQPTAGSVSRNSSPLEGVAAGGSLVGTGNKTGTIVLVHTQSVTITQAETVVAATNQPAAAWPVAIVKPAYTFNPWPFWLLFVLVILFLIYTELRRRISGRFKRNRARVADD